MRAVCLLHANAFNELFRAIDDDGGEMMCCALCVSVLLFSHHLIIIISSLRVLCGVCMVAYFFYLKIYPMIGLYSVALFLELTTYLTTYILLYLPLSRLFFAPKLLLSKIKNVFLFVFSRKKVFVVTFYP